jgi:hypothetical protein
MGCSYVPLHVFLPAADPSSPSIQVVLGMLTHRFVQVHHRQQFLVLRRRRVVALLVALVSALFTFSL